MAPRAQRGIVPILRLPSTAVKDSAAARDCATFCCHAGSTAGGGGGLVGANGAEKPKPLSPNPSSLPFLPFADWVAPSPLGQHNSLPPL